MKKILKLFNYQEVRFIFVGGINTLIGYGSYALFLLVGINYLLANTFSTVLGIINSYIWNRNFTFKSKSKVVHELLKFISVYFISYILGMIVIYYLVSKIGINKYIAGLLNLVMTTMISWFGHKYISFKEKEK